MTSGHVPVPGDARRVQGRCVPALGTSIIRSQQLPELPHAHIHDPRAGLLQGIASQPASQPWRAKFTPCTALLCTGSAGSHEGRQRTALARSQFDVTLLRLHPRLPECPRSEIYGRATLLPGGCLRAERRHEKRGQLQKHPPSQGFRSLQELLQGLASVRQPLGRTQRVTRRGLHGPSTPWEICAERKEVSTGLGWMRRSQRYTMAMPPRSLQPRGPHGGTGGIVAGAGMCWKSPGRRHQAGKEAARGGQACSAGLPF